MGGVALAGAAAYRLSPGWFRFGEPADEASVQTLRSPGWWTLDAGTVVERAAEDRARELSLPYARGGARRQQPGGVRRHDAARAWPGHNLYVSAHDPEAVLLDMEGKPLWRWRYSFERAFPGKRPTLETGFWRRARLLPGGDLLVLIQGGGVFRLDRDSRLRWRSEISAYNDLVPIAGGGVLTLVKEARRMPERGFGEEVLEDFLVELDEGGRVRRKTSILAALLDSPWAAWVRERDTSGPDLLHSNTVQPLDGSMVALHPGFAAGNVMLSLREIDALVVLDPRRGELTWALRGAWKRQHQPVLLPSGDLALFDNRGGSGGGSRLLLVDAVSGDPRRQYPPPGEPLLRSEQGGAVQALPNGNLLVVESQAGRVLELTSDGEVVWEFFSPHRAGHQGLLVAYLFDLQRVPAADWLDSGSGGAR